MPRMNRRAVIKGVSAIGAASGLASCATRSTYIDPMYLRQSVQYDATQAPGTIVVDPSNHFPTDLLQVDFPPCEPPQSQPRSRPILRVIEGGLSKVGLG